MIHLKSLTISIWGENAIIWLLRALLFIIIEVVTYITTLIILLT
jgi:hypothetical protein